MKTEYDLAKLESRKNPYAIKLKKSIRLQLREDVINYFKLLAEDSGVPYHNLIGLYLNDCVANNRKLDISWQ